MPPPRSRYLEAWEKANHVFGVQMCDAMTLTPAYQPQELKIGLDFHKILDAMLVPNELA